MPVSQFECQIARGQIGRYLGGGLLSPDAMLGLEEHLGECPECKALVAERRAALVSQLGGGDIPTHAVVSMAVEEENPLLAALRARSKGDSSLAEEEAPKMKGSPRYAKAAGAKTKPSKVKSAKAKSPLDEAKSKPVMSKPLILGALLSVVLVSMSYFTRANGGKGVLGGKAADTFAFESLAPKAEEAKPVITTAPALQVAKTTEAMDPKAASATTNTTNPDSHETPITAPASTPSATPATLPATTPVAKQPEATIPEKPVADKPVETKPIETKPVESKPVVEKPVAEKPIVKAEPKKPTPAHTPAKKVAAAHIIHRAAARKRTAAHRARRAKRATSSSVRVYGLDGRPLKP